MAAPHEVEIAERGLRLLDQLVLEIMHGVPPNPTSLRMLALAYGNHPQFREEWRAG